MKKVHVSILIVTAIVFSALAFKGKQSGTITGRVLPADGAKAAWALQGADTLKSEIADGTFAFKEAKTGTYTVIVQAKMPFDNVTITNVRVDDGQVTDLGEIRLTQGH
jgi:hypothetical protein